MVVTARRILLLGTVQGCGVRPELARLAAENDWSGSVRNATRGVELIVQGNLPPDERLQAMISSRVPSSATIERCVCSPTMDLVCNGFEIVDSEMSGQLATGIPRDRAICSDCLLETFDPTNRRFRYPFTTCAQCGPRYSILGSMPFDRSRTSMRTFEICVECSREYHDPSDRRFHAQTTSCPACGPQLWNSRDPLRNRAALESAANRLRDGQIVALRGIGGYQLLVDATSAAAVERLRLRKRRTAKPFAVLVPTIDDARELAWLNPEAECQLCSADSPIVLVRQRCQQALAPAINPGLTDIGLLLPTTALHALLLQLVGRPLVCTSGNIDGAPLAYRVDDAEKQLDNIADEFLHHDREILRPIDDSVVRMIASRPVTIRAARGIAPLPLRVQPSSIHRASIIACGGHQKGSMAVANNYQALLGPHIGDLDTLASQERWDENVQQMRELLGIATDGSAATNLVCDAHPGYFSSQWAAGQPCIAKQVWHHHAHVVAGMLEHNWLDREVLGVAWDGTGLGPDGTIWGGEFLRATATQFQRTARLRPFCLPGGDAAITDLRQLGVAMLSQLDELGTADLAKLLDLNELQVRRIRQTLASSFSPKTTSCGRLFDVAALLILECRDTEFEGYAAMRLEAICDDADSRSYLFEVHEGDPLELDWRPVMRQILNDRRIGVSPGAMAMRFHRALAQLILDVCRRVPELPVVLQGGVFQNRVLTELIAENWPVDRQPLGLPGLIPPNDGGLAAGQLAVSVASTAIEDE